jgi:hypothetical protein
VADSAAADWALVDSVAGDCSALADLVSAGLHSADSVLRYCLAQDFLGDSPAGLPRDSRQDFRDDSQEQHSPVDSQQERCPGGLPERLRDCRVDC